MVRNYPTKPEGYAELLGELKTRIREARVRAALAVNSELVLLYWSIGRGILTRQEGRSWGAKVVDRLAADLRKAFPEMKGLSSRNLLFMRNLAQAWPDVEIVKQLVSQIPWGHNIRLMQRVKDPSERVWYIRACIEHGWSRNVLEMQIETGLYRRRGGASSNFERTLPAPQSDLARETLKDPYNFDFLAVADDARERAIERGLVEHIRDFLLELGQGFSFVGNQYRLEVGGEDFYIDLLFYHLKLRCYVVLELKAGGFKPEYTGKLNFYLSAVDDLLRHPDDQPSIGLILCRGRNETVVEYSLRDLSKPLGISEYQLTEALPEKLRGALPSVEEIEAELEESPEGKDSD
ncbi:MAG: DUF1016 domain-containing protein [Planctomycetota bacterium]|nr:MAG: DUF1016 domain-containing protein [Planctomycetota bacterium]